MKRRHVIEFFRSLASIPGPLVALALTATVMTGCQKGAAKTMPPRTLEEVQYSRPVEGEITDFEDFTGRTEAFQSVDVRGRVTGYLIERHFKDGSRVEKGAPLFEIDPRPYKAAHLQAQAALGQAQAKLKLSEIEYKRAGNLVNRGSYSREEYEQAVNNFAEATAGVEVAQAALDLADLNLNWTSVQAPISGHISRRMVDVGNLVKADDTLLTSIVADDPLYVYFEVDERTLLRLDREGKLRSQSGSEADQFHFLAALADEDTFGHKGTVDFRDNKVDPNTGTLQLRGTIANPSPQLLSPGLFVRVRLPIGEPYKALLVSEEALGTDQGRKFLYVVNDQNEVVFRPVKTGPLNNGMRVIVEGLKPDERFVLTGLQRVRPGVKVIPKPAPKLAEWQPQNIDDSEHAQPPQVALTTGTPEGSSPHPAPASPPRATRSAAE